MPRALALAAAFLVGWSLASARAADAPTLPPQMLPPDPPMHLNRNLDTAMGLAQDLADTVGFLETGQAYFKAFRKGTHNPAENEALVRFLEAYERERENAKKEAEILRTWTRERSDLDPDAKPSPKPK